MHIRIEDKIISENIRSFLELLRRAEAKREKKGAFLMETTYKAFLHRNSGKILFAETFKDQPFENHDWKSIFIVYAFDPLTESFQAIAYESEDKKEGFAFTGLSPEAFKAIKGTIHTLNKLSSLLRGPGSDAITKIKALCKLSMDVEPIEKGKNIIVSTWHSVDRMGAEKLLKGKPVGTYFFREDYFAKMLGQQLSEELRKDVRSVTLTVLERDQKIADYTLVHIDHQWRLYNDALFCNVQGYREVEDLLDTKFKGIVKEPLYQYYPEQRIA